jgi:geranylgeranyl pyrophosphate synthase
MSSSLATALESSLPNTQDALQLVLKQYAAELHTCREDIICSLAEAPHAEYLLHYFQRGKMIRPVLVFLAAEAAGVAAKDVLLAAEAMELLHVAALIHDDIMDRAEERRGLPSLHTQIGLPAAIVIGDYLILQAFETLTRSATLASSERTLAAVRHLAHFAKDCCRGQIQELMPAADECTEQEYFAVVRGKTASQFAAAVSIGAAFGIDDRNSLAHIRAFGMNTGIVFQIRDDELDLEGDSDVMGKPAGNSIETGKPFLPFIYLRKHCSSDAWERLVTLQKTGCPRDEIAQLLRSEGVLARVDKVKKRFLALALAELSTLHIGPPRDTLRSIALYSAHRNS